MDGRIEGVDCLVGRIEGVDFRSGRIEGVDFLSVGGGMMEGSESICGGGKIEGVDFLSVEGLIEGGVKPLLQTLFHIHLEKQTIEKDEIWNKKAPITKYQVIHENRVL